jgi:eukaryotic-like serine/threonine-protein kinase
LGAILYAALTGQAPHQGSSPVDLLLRVMASEPLSPRSLNPLIPRELERICLRCLAKSPDRRYPTAADLATDLELFVRGEQPLGVSLELVESVRRLPRRMPALCAHLGAIASVEVVRQGSWLFSGPEVMAEQWSYHWQFTAVFLLWAAACTIFHFLLHKPATMEATRYLWAGTDVLFVTWILLLAQGPITLLYPAYALLIVAAGSLFRVRLIVFMTTLAILSFLIVTRLRPDESHSPHYLLLFVGILGIIGAIMGYHVRRLRTLYGYFEQGHR